MMSMRVKVLLWYLLITIQLFIMDAVGNEENATIDSHPLFSTLNKTTIESSAYSSEVNNTLLMDTNVTSSSKTKILFITTVDPRYNGPLFGTWMMWFLYTVAADFDYEKYSLHLSIGCMPMHQRDSKRLNISFHEMRLLDNVLPCSYLHDIPGFKKDNEDTRFKFSVTYPNVRRLLMIQALAETQLYDIVMYADVDAFFVRNPLPYVLDLYQTHEYSAVFQRDEYNQSERICNGLWALFDRTLPRHMAEHGAYGQAQMNDWIRAAMKTEYLRRPPPFYREELQFSSNSPVDRKLRAWKLKLMPEPHFYRGVCSSLSDYKNEVIVNHCHSAWFRAHEKEIDLEKNHMLLTNFSFIANSTSALSPLAKYHNASTPRIGSTKTTTKGTEPTNTAVSKSDNGQLLRRLQGTRTSPIVITGRQAERPIFRTKQHSAQSPEMRGHGISSSEKLNNLAQQQHLSHSTSKLSNLRGPKIPAVSPSADYEETQGQGGMIERRNPVSTIVRPVSIHQIPRSSSGSGKLSASSVMTGSLRSSSKYSSHRYSTASRSNRTSSSYSSKINNKSSTKNALAFTSGGIISPRTDSYMPPPVLLDPSMHDILARVFPPQWPYRQTHKVALEGYYMRDSKDTASHFRGQEYKTELVVQEVVFMRDELRDAVKAIPGWKKMAAQFLL